MIKQFIKNISAEMGVDIQYDEKLFQSLKIHLNPAIHRLKFQMSQKNPLREEIYAQYRELVKIISNQIGLIENEFNVEFTDDEIAFITVHIASSLETISNQNDSIKVVLLCGSGIGTSQLLKTKLSNFYTEFEIIDAYSIYQIDETELLRNKIDYIISTVPCNVTHIPVVNVDPFLNQDSRQKLNEIVNHFREDKIKKFENEGYSIRELLPINRIKISSESVDRNQAIAKTTDLLVKDGIVDSNYANEIVNQFEKFGPYMVISPHIALIHASTQHVIKDAGFSIIYFDKGILFNHERNDPVYLVIALATKNAKNHLRALGQLSELISNKEKIEKVLNGEIDFLNQLIDEISMEEG